MKISRQNFVIEKTKTLDHTNAKRHSEVSNTGIFYLQVPSLSSKHILKFSYSGMIPEIALNYTVKTPFCNIQYHPTTVAADPQGLQLLPSMQLLLSKKQEAGQFVEPRPVCFKVHRMCDWGGQPCQGHHTQSESYWLLSVTWTFPAVLSLPFSTPGCPPSKRPSWTPHSNTAAYPTLWTCD